MDYLVWSSFRDTLLLLFVLSYDIMCQYSINFWDRMGCNFGGRDWLFLTGAVSFLWVVPKFHLPAHIRKCWEEYNFAFTRWTAHTDGESVERGWSLLNRLRRVLREMGPGAWRDTLEDHVGDHNWKKTFGLGGFCIPFNHEGS